MNSSGTTDKDTIPIPEHAAVGFICTPWEIDVWHGSPEDRPHDRRCSLRTETGWSFPHACALTTLCQERFFGSVSE